jgi:arylsulfatase A-like enzyme
VKYSHDRWINDMGQVNIIPYLNNKTGDPHKALYWRFWDQSAIRMGNWKFLKAGSREFLFNVEADDHETKNLITKKLSFLIVSMINARQTCLRIIK